MYKYLAITYNNSGQWTSGSLTNGFIFEADGDKDALVIISRYLVGRKHIELRSLSRITVSLKTVSIDIPEDSANEEFEELTHQEQAQIGFSMLHISQDLPRQLSTFSQSERDKRLAELEKRLIKDTTDEMIVASMPVPKVGDHIYVPPRLHLSRGRHDTAGGRAAVSMVTIGRSGGEKVHYITVAEIPGVSFNWEHHLALKQDQLRQEFGTQRAHPDPDTRQEFNEG